MKKVVGYLMILIVLVGVIGMMIVVDGLKDTLKIFGVSVLIGIFVGVALDLIDSD